MNQGINPNYLKKDKKEVDAHLLFEGIRKGDKIALAQSITLLESDLDSKREVGLAILKLAKPFTGKSRRIGITGVPGAGKSSFIEVIGQNFISDGKKLAVLAIDPSSSIHHGSILGDKTRMNELSQIPSVFIRPTASGNELGGLARNTHESILLCEAAGYDYVFIETVGVGQSETEIRYLADMFILLLVAGAGDELQGIKRGIMEMADLILVNKADGDNKKRAEKSVKEIENALKFLPSFNHPWQTKVNVFSTLDKAMNITVLNIVNQFFSDIRQDNRLNENRKKQELHIFNKYLKNSIFNKLIKSNSLSNDFYNIEKEINKGNLLAFEAVDKMLIKLNLNK